MIVRLTVEVSSGWVMLVVRVRGGGTLVALAERSVSNHLDLDIKRHLVALACLREALHFIFFLVYTGRQ